MAEEALTGVDSPVAEPEPPMTSDVEAHLPPAEAETRTWWPLAIAIGFPVLLFFVLPPLTRAGLWDPYELNVADLSRRIALNLHGAATLALDGADNSLPHLNDLGRPQLPFTSIALGFKIFGLHEWAGRAPLALWGVLGVLATFGFVSRLVDRRAGVYAAIALTTMPLYFVESRTMLGDIVTMSAFAMSFGGLAVAVFGRRADDPFDGRTRALWLLVAGLGVISGYYSRGGIIGIGVPALAIGAAWLLAFTNGQRRFDSMATGIGVASLLVGACFIALGANALNNAERISDLNPLIGAMVRPPTKYPTFDFEIGALAASLAPWSAFAPFAFGRLFIAPRVAGQEAFSRESQARVALLVGAAVALVVHGWMAARVDLVAFAAPAIIAAGCAIAIRDFERGAHPSVAIGVGTAVLLGLMHHELHNMPEKAFHAFGVMTTTFPESFKETSIQLWTVVLVGFAGIAFLTFAERFRMTSFRQPASGDDGLAATARKPFEVKSYLRVLIALRDAWDGMLALAYFAMVAGASLAGLALWLGTRQHWRWLPTLGTQMRDFVLNAWWVFAFGPIFVVFGVYFWTDVWIWTFEDSRPTSKQGSWWRGFEPFGELGSTLKNGRLGATLPKLVMGKLTVTNEALDDGIGPMAALVLAPLMYLQVPGIVFVGLYGVGNVKWLVALALAVPAGVALFLALGIMGNVLRGGRAAFLGLFTAVCGALLCFAYYPALANQLSPKEVFESYAKVKKNDEPLALFGVGGRTAAYYAGGQPLILKDTQSAYDWLTTASSGRRFLAVRAEELGRLNKAWREKNPSLGNLPVLDARSSQIILVASSLDSSEKNQSPLNRIVLGEAPKPQHKLDVTLDDKLQALGYDITDDKMRLVDHISPGKKYHQRTYFKMLAPVQSEWEMFIHIDGFHKRHNGDHKLCEGKYPMALWLKDDLIMDDYEFSLEPNFTPGAYTDFFGLFVGETRMKPKGANADSENRVNAGALRVQ